MLVPVLLASVIIVGLLLFVVYVGFSAMSAGVLQGFNGIANFVRFFADPAAGSALRNTVVFALLSLVIAFLFGVPLAWLAERTDLPARGLIWLTMLTSLVIPGFLLGMGWLFLAHPRIGFINVTFMQLFHLDTAPLPVTNVVGMSFVEGGALAPLIFILMAPSMRTMDPSLEEAARMSGATSGEVLWRITLPLMLPSLLAAAVYSSINAIGTFDIPAIIGLANRVFTFSTLIYSMTNPVQGYPDYSTPAAGGVLMLVIALLLTLVYGRLLIRARQFQVVSGKLYRPAPVKLGHWSSAAWMLVGTYTAVALEPIS